MSHKIYKWDGEGEYRNKSQRDTRANSGMESALYPWNKMSDGDFFFILCDPKNEKDIHSKVNVLRASARNFGFWIKCYRGKWEKINGQFALKVIMDGKIK